MKMRVAITHPNAEARSRWCTEIERRLPGAQTFAWIEPDGGWDPAPGAATIDADYAIGWQPSTAFFASVRGLKAFFSTGAGVNNVLDSPAYPEALPLVRLEDVGMARQMAEYCSYEVIRLYRHRARYAAQQRAGTWRELATSPREDFGVGVLGLGVLGAAVARALVGFGYPVRGHSRTAKEISGVACFSGAAELPAFLSSCRVLILMVPLTAETTDMVDGDLLALLPAGAHLINVARGKLVVDADLLAALDGGHLGGATLDVFREEPLAPDHPFWTHPKLRITPHIAAITLVPESAQQVAAKIEQLERGEPISGIVERSRGY